MQTDRSPLNCQSSARRCLQRTINLLNKPTTALDVAIVGGGVAGTWLLRTLIEKGYNAVLLEREAVGCGQTLASQGMIHGGLKYALNGMLTSASEAIASMPARWRNCLAGDDLIDLKGLPLLSDRYYMFAEASALGRMTSFFASKALRGRIDRVAPADWPAVFESFNGVVYALNDFVIDTAALLQRLTSGLEARVLHAEVNRSNLRRRENGFQIELDDTILEAEYLLSCAGNGSKALIEDLGITELEVQQRPLKQVLFTPPVSLPMYAHCLTGIYKNEPRLTITSHATTNGLVWYVGGQLANDGADRSDAEQLEFARSELINCLPWLDWHDVEMSVLSVDRAEPQQHSGLKPDNAYVCQIGRFIQCFPTKLTLTPHLADKVIDTLPPPHRGTNFATQHSRANIGSAPW